MFGSIRNFLSRHKRKLWIGAGLTTALGVGLGYLVYRRTVALARAVSAETLRRHALTQHYDAMRAQIHRVVSSIVSHHAVHTAQLFDTAPLRAQLTASAKSSSSTNTTTTINTTTNKNNNRSSSNSSSSNSRSNSNNNTKLSSEEKLAIFKVIAAQAWTHLVVNMYCLVLTQCFSSLQWAILARESFHGRSSEDDLVLGELGKHVLLDKWSTTVANLLQDKVAWPTEFGRPAVIEELLPVLGHCRDAVEGTVGDAQFVVSLKDFLPIEASSPSSSSSSGGEGEGRLMKELRTLCCSKDFETVFSACANAVFVKVAGKLKEMVVVEGRTVTVADLSPRVSKLAKMVLSESEFVETAEQCEWLQRLASYVYAQP